tara:strand:- start:46133 stop:46597 length:465 start_codon:yes stop_codon:yes gene_type:complete
MSKDLKQVKLFRTMQNDNQTVGHFCIQDFPDEDASEGFGIDAILCSLELPDKNNKQSVSRIPAGTYTVVARHSPKFGHHFHVLGVPGRSYILIHTGNYHTDIRGCILIGMEFAHVGSTKEIDVKRSRTAMEVLHKHLDGQDEIKLTIIDPCSQS